MITHKMLVEFVGTFFLVLVIGLVVHAGTPLAPIAIGAILMAVVYMGGHVSGAHFNPAVSLAALLRGALPASHFLPYVLAQVAGGLAAGAATRYLAGAAIVVAPGAGVSPAQALLVEVLFTFALASVVLNVATSKDHPGNSFYGAAIGLVVMAGAFAGGPISGGAFNPAVAIGQNAISGIFGNLWIYLAGPLAGGALAAAVFRITNPAEF